VSAWKGTLEQPYDFYNALSTGTFVTRRATKSCQEACMTGNAIADGTKAREINEETFLKERWQGTVEVGGLGKSPQFLSDLRSFGREAEKIRKHSKSFADAIF